MNDEKPIPYELHLSGYVSEQLIHLGRMTKARGDGQEYLAALLEFDRRLRIYPQFGDPLMDLKGEEGHMRLGLIPPLSMRYTVFEERRIVFVAARPVILSKRT